MTGAQKPFHAACFRCSVCSCKLAVHSFERTEAWVLFCKPHFKQHLLTATKGSSSSVAPPPGSTTIGLYGAAFYSGDESHCRVCTKRVYHNEMAIASCRSGGENYEFCYHRTCFCCTDCGTGPLRPDQYELELQHHETSMPGNTDDHAPSSEGDRKKKVRVTSGTLLCKVHFNARRMAKSCSGAGGAVTEAVS